MRLLVFLLVVGSWIAIAAWLVRDAQRRGTNGVAIGLLLGWLGPFAILLWVALRPSIQREIRTYEDFESAEDAFDWASQLDMQGDWYAAEELYRYIAERWPSQMHYAFACIRGIQDKQDLAQQ
ncbi:MAG: hypothetical protein AAGI63_09110 [Planctomycetota bacterium]